MNDLTARVRALPIREDTPEDRLRAAVVQELRDWRDGLVIAPMNLLLAVERYDEEARGQGSLLDGLEEAA